MAIIKLGMLEWPGHDREITSDSNSRLGVSKRPGGVDRGYFCYHEAFDC